MLSQSHLENQRPQLVNALTRIRQEWQEASDTSNLLDVEGNVGLILIDVTQVLELTRGEQLQILGRDLFKEASSVLVKI